MGSACVPSSWRFRKHSLAFFFTYWWTLASIKNNNIVIAVFIIWFLFNFMMMTIVMIIMMTIAIVMLMTMIMMGQILQSGSDQVLFSTLSHKVFFFLKIFCDILFDSNDNLLDIFTFSDRNQKWFLALSHFLILC